MIYFPKAVSKPTTIPFYAHFSNSKQSYLQIQPSHEKKPTPLPFPSLSSNHFQLQISTDTPKPSLSPKPTPHILFSTLKPFSTPNRHL